ncbi:FtsX-like permease family protein [Sporanaerobacter acetigenes]|uniref:FtsX-like permease family protein n=1 Tax=Sporanaerobacter acetigenes DSM 13106 TaxID=1123281 RepID=A0A1M5UIH2_9FIRM|nr:FtsX-like permease family protein [Sporanaerobacter acetigenes]SHH62721.1 FtsX-like permease family protein [Sporanaerobacter acetigenes DSM 13106]
MLLKNSLKQMGRTKARMIVFLILIVLTVTFLSLGVNLWQTCNGNLEKYGKVFTTVGVVNQKENSVELNQSWNAARKEYTYWDEPIYDYILPISLLDFEGANYIIKPEQRPYYGAYSPDIKVMSSEEEEYVEGKLDSVVEIIPYENCIPSDLVKVKVKRVLYGTYDFEGTDIWFCDEFNDNPGLIEKGKTYITVVSLIGNEHKDSYMEVPYEFFPHNPTISTQKNIKGETVAKDSIPDDKWVEVTDNFYGNEEGMKWKNLGEADDRFFKHTFPIVPTNKTEFLMEFNQGNAYIYDGRDITESEYEEGEKVCIIPKKFAMLNALKVGDNINLKLYYADYEKSVSQTFSAGRVELNFGLLNAEGEVYPVFEDSEYKIVGLYSNTADPEKRPTGYELGSNAVIIPSKSVKNSDEDNIVGYGPMKGYNTSFQIPNGTTKVYLEKFKALGINNLEVEFYDGGYERLSSGMGNLKTVAVILVAVSAATTLAILFFFVFLFISKQKKRTAIERSLGMNRKECTLSMLYGILIIIALGAVIGSFAGFKTADFVISKSTNMETELYSTAFSNWVNNADKMAEVAETSVPVNYLTPIVLCLVVILVSIIISLILIKNNLKAEPLELLSKSEE